MLLARLLDGVPVTKLFSTVYGKAVQVQELEVRAVQYDSRRVERGDLFVAIRGMTEDGHRYVTGAIDRGAVAVVVEDDHAVPDELFLHSGVMKIVVGNSRQALARIAGNFHGDPSRHLMLIGVTGTNGKTTCTYLIKSVLESAGLKVGLLGTVAYLIGDRTVPATHTTPESLELNGLLAEMVREGCGAAVMEVSSHALALRRVEGLTFRAALFTNLTQDHLDFHGSMEEYFRAKRLLFDGLPPGSLAVTNADDPRGSEIVRSTQATVLRYGTRHEADVSATVVRMTVHGTDLRVSRRGVEESVHCPLTGGFNVANVLGACALGWGLGLPWEAIKRGIERMNPVRGRFEQVTSPAGWSAIVDYAHTPDALENCLRAIRELVQTGGHIITVFGCGGDRDALKRPMMGRIASELSDTVIVTSDNPRSEQPEEIVRQILKGVVPGRDVRVEIDRGRAIAGALGMARSGDVVLIAGKGHETYQLIGDRRLAFDDREQVERFMHMHS